MTAAERELLRLMTSALLTIIGRQFPALDYLIAPIRHAQDRLNEERIELSREHR